MTLIDIVKEIQRETAEPAPRLIDRPIAKPTYPGDLFWAGERLGDILRWHGVKPENLPRERRGKGRR